jgi:putative heme-binding domain-containing protein
LKTAVDAFARQVASDPTYPWNSDVIFTFGMSVDPKHQEIVRQQFEKFELRTAVLLVLSEDPHPQEQDRAKFIAGLDSSFLEVLTACIGALEKLPESKDPAEFAELVKLLRRLGAEKSEYPLRERVVKLLQRNSGEEFPFQFGFTGYHPQTEAVEQWTRWLEKEYPEEAARVSGGTDVDLGEFKKLLASVEWEAGDAAKGKQLFVSRGCAQCHNGSAGLGPDLAGATGRFSRDDLFVSIAAPNRDVSPRYQTILVETKQGKTYTGLIVYESVDGVLLRSGTNQTFRIDAADIESQRSLPTSVMPTGLLKELQPHDLADLYRYLEELNVKTADKTAARKK